MNLINKIFEDYRMRKNRNQESQRLLVEVPYVYALFGMSLSSGLSIYDSLKEFVEFSPESCKGEFKSAVHKIENGKSVSESLREIQEIRELRSLANILIDCSDLGTSALDAIDHLFRDSIGRLRRESNAAVKKLSVKMLFPLVLCILPAFVILSVTPVVINGFFSIDL